MEYWILYTGEDMRHGRGPTRERIVLPGRGEEAMRVSWGPAFRVLMAGWYQKKIKRCMHNMQKQ